MRLQSISVGSILLILLGSSVGATPAATPPDQVAAVIAFPAPSLVVWTPVSGVEGYEVYGVTSVGLVEITTTTNTWLVVTGDYQSFAVSSVIGGIPGSPQYVTAGTCVAPDLNTTPPQLDIKQCDTSTSPSPLPVHDISLHVP